MSVSEHFLNKFCKPSPITHYTRQDIIDDFMDIVKKQVSPKNCIITYKPTPKFLCQYTKYDIIKIICDVLVKQMQFKETKKRFTFNHDYNYMDEMTYHFINTTISYQYNEPCHHENQCSFWDNPDGIVIKFGYSSM